MAKKKGKSNRAQSQSGSGSQKKHPIVKAPAAGAIPWGLYAIALAIAITAGYFLTKPKQDNAGSGPETPTAPVRKAAGNVIRNNSPNGWDRTTNWPNG